MEALGDNKSRINETVLFCGSEKWRLNEKIASKLLNFK